MRVFDVKNPLECPFRLYDMTAGVHYCRLNRLDCRYNTVFPKECELIEVGDL